MRATRRPNPRTRRSAISPAVRGTSAPRGPQSRSELQRLAEFVGATVRWACTTTLNVRHRPVSFAAARRHRAPPVFQKVSRDQEPRGVSPVPTRPLRTTPHRQSGQPLTGPTGTITQGSGTAHPARSRSGSSPKTAGPSPDPTRHCSGRECKCGLHVCRLHVCLLSPEGGARRGAERTVSGMLRRTPASGRRLHVKVSGGCLFVRACPRRPVAGRAAG